jgi:hypothetical protein
MTRILMLFAAMMLASAALAAPKGKKRKVETKVAPTATREMRFDGLRVEGLAPPGVWVSSAVRRKPTGVLRLERSFLPRVFSTVEAKELSVP